MVQTRDYGEFAAGLTSWLNGGTGPNSVAASEVFAETFILWRKLLESKFERK